MHYIIGCGGVGGYLAPVLVKLLKGGRDVTLVDGDNLEKKNLDRQLFDESMIGDNKAFALANKYGTIAHCGWFSDSAFRVLQGDVLLVCVDNHPARAAALRTVDRCGCRCIIAANETYSSEAYYYQHEWKGTNADPRIYYPEIKTDTSGDPRAASIGCTGVAQENNVQLASANFMAAALAVQLYQIWFGRHKLSKSTIPHLPYRLNANKFALETHKVLSVMEETKTTETERMSDE